MGDLAIAPERDEMHAVEDVRRPDRLDEIAGDLDSGVGVALDQLDDATRDGELGDRGRQLAGHLGTGDDDHAGVDRAPNVDRFAPGDELPDVVADLRHDEIGIALPRWQRNQS